MLFPDTLTLNIYPNSHFITTTQRDVGRNT